MSLNQPLVWRNPIWKEVASQLAHVESELCWCVIRSSRWTNMVERLLCTKRSRGIELAPVEARERRNDER